MVSGALWITFFLHVSFHCKCSSSLESIFKINGNLFYQCQRKWIVLSDSCEYKGLWNVDRRERCTWWPSYTKQLKMQWPVNTDFSCTLKLSFLQKFVCYLHSEAVWINKHICSDNILDFFPLFIFCWGLKIFLETLHSGMCMLKLLWSAFRTLWKHCGSVDKDYDMPAKLCILCSKKCAFFQVVENE